MSASTPRRAPVPRGTIPAARVRFPLCFDDLSFPNDVIRREHSPPRRHASEPVGLAAV